MGSVPLPQNLTDNNPEVHNFTKVAVQGGKDTHLYKLKHVQ